jgi:ketosteroid isomerase-like protein
VRDAEQVASELARIVRAGDAVALAELYAPDVRMWYSIGNAERTREEGLAGARLLFEITQDRRQECVRVTRTETGYVSQYHLHATLQDGQQLRIPSCIVVTVDDGRISRLEEYMDAITAGPLLALLRGAATASE